MEGREGRDGISSPARRPLNSWHRLEKVPLAGLRIYPGEGDEHLATAVAKQLKIGV